MILLAESDTALVGKDISWSQLPPQAEVGSHAAVANLATALSLLRAAVELPAPVRAVRAAPAHHTAPPPMQPQLVVTVTSARGRPV